MRLKESLANGGWQVEPFGPPCPHAIGGLWGADPGQGEVDVSSSELQSFATTERSTQIRLPFDLSQRSNSSLAID